MTAVGITGHQALSPRTQRRIAAAIAAQLAELPNNELVGYTSLAAGADQIFALSVLAAGGTLHTVIPARDYASTFAETRERKAFEALLGMSDSRIDLPFDQSSEEAFMAAGQFISDHSKLLFAVWDGAPAGGLGGTADVVKYAETHGRNVIIIWPDGSSRSPA